MSRHGPRYTGGYQFPSTNAVTLTRGEPVRRAGPFGPSRATIELVPLTGGRPDYFDVCIEHNDGRRSGVFSCPTLGRDEAERLFRERAAQLEAGVHPDEL